MKVRKTLNHIALVDEVIKAIRMFKADPKVIKFRIEQLIEREYLERSEKDKGVYIYKPEFL